MVWSMTPRVKARLAKVILLFVLVACGELLGAEGEGPAAADSPTTTVLEATTTTEKPGTTLATAPEPPETTSPPPTLAGAPEWFDLEKARVTLSGYFQAFDLTDASTYRFRSTFSVWGVEDDSEIWSGVGEILGEVAEDPPAVRRVFIDSHGVQGERIEIGDRIWARQEGSTWKEIVEEGHGDLPYFAPYLSYELAALFAGDTLEWGAVSVVGTEEVNGLDVLHLRVTPGPADVPRGGEDTDQVVVEIWITPSGLLVSFHHRIGSAQEGEGSDGMEWTWDLHDLGAEFEIRPPLP
jgi:hypothetical protein